MALCLIFRQTIRGIGPLKQVPRIIPRIKTSHDFLCSTLTCDDIQTFVTFVVGITKNLFPFGHRLLFAVITFVNTSVTNKKNSLQTKV